MHSESTLRVNLLCNTLVWPRDVLFGCEQGTGGVGWSELSGCKPNLGRQNWSVEEEPIYSPQCYSRLLGLQRVDHLFTRQVVKDNSHPQAAAKLNTMVFDLRKTAGQCGLSQKSDASKWQRTKALRIYIMS